MNKRVIIIIIVIALVVIGLGIGAWLFYRQADTPAPVPAPAEPISTIGYQFPKSADEINWEDSEIFKTGLTKSALSILEKLPQASSYYISLEIAPDLASDIKGHQIVRYFNAEDEPLTEIYYRLYPNFQGGKIEVS
ncbi:MAG: hypothetical protein MUP11_01115, partial [Anaerolineales bacterium]|nr:hypothetical protein [Anaerolineales bacterium]